MCWICIHVSENVLNMHTYASQNVFYSNSNKCTIFDYEWTYVNFVLQIVFVLFIQIKKKGILEKTFTNRKVMSIQSRQVISHDRVGVCEKGLN